MAKYKHSREDIHAKYGGRCAYCGIEVVVKKSKPTDNKMHIDHIHPKFHGGTNDIENLTPSCKRCNLWKKTFSLEEFRREIGLQVWRLKEQSAGFRLALDYGLVTVPGEPRVINQPIEVVFYFEGYEKGLSNEFGSQKKTSRKSQ